MLKRVVDFFLIQNQVEDEEALDRQWLRAMLVAALITVTGYMLLLVLLKSYEIQYFMFGGIFLAIFGLLMFLLHIGKVRAAAVIFSLSSVVGMFFAALAFGGVRGSSYFGIVVGIILMSIFLRGRAVIAGTSVSILLGGFLALAEIKGFYQPHLVHLGPYEMWLGSSIIFIMSAATVAVAARAARRLVAKEYEEVQERRKAEVALREQTRYLSALHDTTLAIVRRLDLIPLLHSILSYAETLGQTTHGYVDLFIPNVEGIVQQVGHGVFESLNGSVVLPGQGVSGRVLASGDIHVVYDYQRWPDRIPAYADAGFQGIAAVPMKLNGRVIGILGLAYTEAERRFSDMQIEFLERFGEMAALAIDNAQLYQAAQEEIRIRKDAQDALRRSEASLKLALKAANMGTWSWDISNNIVHWSDTVYTLFGLEPGIDTLSFENYMQRIHPRDRGRVKKQIEQSLKDPKIPYSVEHRILWHDGSTRWLEGKGQVGVDEHGRPVRMSGTVTNITERKEAEQALHKANRQLEKDTLVLKRRSTLLKVAGEVSRAVSGILAPDVLSQQVVELVRKRFDLYYVGLFLLDARGEFAVLRAATGEAGREMLKNGHKLPVANTSMIGWSIVNRRARIALDVGEDAVRFNNPLLPHTRSELAVPLFSRGQVLGGLSIQSQQGAAFSQEDIDTFQTMADNLANAILNARLYEQLEKELEDRKSAEQAVRDLNARLEERVMQRTADLQAANKELEAFSYSVSHDLRAPLRALDGFSRILMDDFRDGIPAEGHTYLAHIRTAAVQMSQLIDDILRLSRITRSEIHFNPLNLSNLASSIIADLKTREPGRQVQVTVREDMSALGDERLLRVAMENMLSNAWKFTSKTQRARITVGKLRKGGQDVYYVRDNGVGFNMDYADKLFGAFQRLHTSDEFPGTGIGLAIVQRVIHKHGGRIWAESQQGQGATFFFTIQN